MQRTNENYIHVDMEVNDFAYFMFKQNLNNDTFNFLVEVHNLKHCGCLIEQNEIIACQEKYQVQK